MSATAPAGAPSRSAIARILRETADLLELRGENPFRCRAYANGARAIEGMLEDPQERFEAGTLAEVKGIGPGLVSGIAELLQTGKLALHEELKATFPAGVRELLRLPGLGPKRLRTLVETLKIDSVVELERACSDGRVAALPGFGEKSQQKIVEGLAAMRRYAERHLLPVAVETAERLRLRLSNLSHVERVEIAGSVRRRLETIGDLDFVAGLRAGAGEGGRAAVLGAFLADPETAETLENGLAKASIRLNGGFRADLLLVEAEELASAWLHLTGNAAHNVALRARAKARGWTLNERGLFDGEERRLPDGGSEAGIYRTLELAFVPPEAREGLNEIELAEGAFAAGKESLPESVRVADLRGTFHVHSTFSDGIATVAQMAEAAARLGWEYLGIADHSKAAAYAGGLDAERVRKQWVEIDAWNAAGLRPWLFKGTECDILADGTLDYDDELLAAFDFVVVSVHSRFALAPETMTARLVRAVSHPRVTFLGHPTGRLLLMRDAYAFDLDAVLDAARANGVIVELNANPHRLDLDWRELRGWLARGMPTSIHPDAHSPQGLQDVAWGVSIARKALAPARSVFNTRTLAEVREHFAARRSRAERSAP